MTYQWNPTNLEHLTEKEFFNDKESNKSYPGYQTILFFLEKAMQTKPKPYENKFEKLQIYSIEDYAQKIKEKNAEVLDHYKALQYILNFKPLDKSKPLK